MSAIIVIGPESSGTRMVTRLLLEKGCLGDAEHNQHWDKNPITHVNKTKNKPVVWRKSVPHGRKWPDMLEMKSKLENAGHAEITVVVILRDWYPQIKSMSEKHLFHVKEDRSEANLMNVATAQTQEAVLHIFKEIEKAGFQKDFLVVSYEAFIFDGRSINAMMRFLRLPEYTMEELDEKHKLHYASEKWYGEF